MRYIYFICFLFTISYSQNNFTKKPLTKYYHYNSIFWDMATNEDMLLFFATENGILVKNDDHEKLWKFKEINKIKLVEDKKLLYGSRGDVGLFYIDEDGGHYKSFAKYFSRKDQNFSEIYEILTDNNKNYYFVADNKIIKLHDKGSMIDYDIINTNLILGAFQMNKIPVIAEEDKGLVNLLNKKIINNNEIFKTNGLSNFVKIDDNYFFASYDNNKLYKLSTDGKKVQILNTEADDQLKKYEIYKLSRLNNYLVVLTYSGGVFIIDTNGKLIAHYNKQNANFEHTAYFAKADKQNNLWVSTIKGLTLIYPQLPVSDLSSLVKDVGQINSLYYDNNKILVATTQGTYLVDPNINSTKQLFSSESWDIKKAGDKYLIATTNGVYSYNGKLVELYQPIVNSYKIKIEKNNIYIFSTSGITKITDDKIAKEFSVKAYLPTNIWEVDNKKAVITTKTGGVLLWDSRRNKLIKKISPDKENSFTDIVEFQDVKLIYSKNKVFELDKNFNLKLSEKQLPENTIVNKIIRDKNNNYWVLTTSYPIIFNSNAEIIPDHLAYLFEKVKTFDVSGNKTVLSDGNNLILLHKNSVKLPNTAKLVINYFMTKGDTIYIYEATDYYNLPTNLPYKYNTITVSYGLTNYIGKNFYKYSLNDSPEQEAQNTITLGPLNEDTYKLSLFAANPLVGNAASTVEFSITPPWFRTTLAYILYAVALILLIFGSVKAYTYKIEADRKRLQQLVDEQTHELRQINEELKQLNEELQSVNEELNKKHTALQEAHNSILQSINYATRIQQAILPDTIAMEKYFSDYSFLYLPRDKVSGDFFWLYERNGTKFFAVVDCTGHGVPGAMMSMLGASALNRIALSNPEITPAQILTELNKDVYSTLHTKGGSQNDGMDLIMCMFSENKIIFAGANRPLWIRKNNNIEELTTTKKAIGQEPDIQFQNYELSWNDFDTLYMFSDGVHDQLGGPKDRKFGKQRLRELFIKLSDKPADEQIQTIKLSLEKWKEGTYMEQQTDDITLFIFVK